MIQSTHEAEMRLTALRQQPGTSILVIEDHDSVRGGIVAVLQLFFPNAKIVCFKGFDVEDIEVLIEKHPSIVLLDADLGSWSHPFYKNYGPNLIGPILRGSPQTLIISMSMQPSHNEHAIKEGAHIGVKKGDLHGLFQKVFPS